MNNLNSVLVEGNLTRDPELAYTTQGTARTRLGVACHRSFRKDDEYQEETSFFEVTVWGRQAEVCAEYLSKGRPVRVVGRLRQDRWEDQDGNPRARVTIVAEHVEFGPKKEAAEDDASSSASGEGTPIGATDEEGQEKEAAVIY